jgi:hypothetical protein
LVKPVRCSKNFVLGHFGVAALAALALILSLTSCSGGQNRPPQLGPVKPSSIQGLLFPKRHSLRVRLLLTPPTTCCRLRCRSTPSQPGTGGRFPAFIPAQLGTLHPFPWTLRQHGESDTTMVEAGFVAPNPRYLGEQRATTYLDYSGGQLIVLDQAVLLTLLRTPRPGRRSRTKRFHCDPLRHGQTCPITGSMALASLPSQPLGSAGVEYLD